MGASSPGAYTRGRFRPASSAAPGGNKNLGPERGHISPVEFRQNNSGPRDMPRFFFHVRDADGETSFDFEGQELANLAAARAEAINANREMLGERLLHGGSLNHRRIEIADEKGTVLASIDANDVLFQDGQFRDFSDDVTKSAPSISLSATASKRSAR